MSRKIAVVLAAGKGTRMKSDLPKVLIEICGRPMIEYVLDSLAAVGFDRIAVVVGYRAEDVKKALVGRQNLAFVLQEQQQGTGHAVMMARQVLEEHDGPVAVVTGDAPLLQPDSLAALLTEYDRRRPACVMGTIHKENPAGLGRIVQGAAGEFVGIVEEKDATEDQRRITEVNMSCYVFDCRATFGGARRVAARQCPRRVLHHRLSWPDEAQGAACAGFARAQAHRGPGREYNGRVARGRERLAAGAGAAVGNQS